MADSAPHLISAERVREALKRTGVEGVAPTDVQEFVGLHGLDVETLAEERLDEIVLARWYASGAPAAAEAFVAAFGDVVRSIGMRSLRPEEVDDYQQRVLISFLLSDGSSAPRIARYSGRGSLRGFVRTVASRFAIDLRRARGVESQPSGLASTVAAELDPAARLESEQAKAIMAEALTGALRALKPGERRALRMRYVLGFSVARTAEALGIHEISVSRLVTRVRDRLFKQVHDALSRDSSAAAPEALAALSASLEISLTQWLRTHVD